MLLLNTMQYITNNSTLLPGSLDGVQVSWVNMRVPDSTNVQELAYKFLKYMTCGSLTPHGRDSYGMIGEVEVMWGLLVPTNEQDLPKY